MSVTSRQFSILLPGVLILCVGCTGGRLRDRFASDRDYLTMSELEEYDREHSSIYAETDGKPTLLASWNRDRNKTDEERSKDTEGKQRRFLNLGGLFGRDSEEVPDDPFIAFEDESSAEDGEDADTADENRTAVVTVSSSDDAENEAPATDEASQLIHDDWVAEVREREPTSPTGTGESIADILAEFGQDDEPDSVIGDFDELLVGSADSDSGFEDFVPSPDQAELEEDDETNSVGSDFDNLLAGSADSDSEFEDFVLSLDESDNDSSDDVPMLSFSENDKSADRYPAIDFSEPSHDATSTSDDTPALTFDNKQTNEDRSSDAAFEIQPREVPQQSPDIARKQVFSEVREPLWVASDDTDWSDTEPIKVTTPTANSFNLPPIDSVQVSPKVTPAFPDHRAASHDGSDAISLANRPVVTKASSAAPSTADRLAPAFADDEFGDPVFQTDFSAQAQQPPTEVPPAASADRASQSAGLIRDISTRAWILILGGVIIAYLLFAPERKNHLIPRN